MNALKTEWENIKMLQQPETVAGNAAVASPGIVYATFSYLIGMPIEKWVSVAVLIYTLLQIAVLIRDRMRKRRHKRPEGLGPL